MTLPPDLLDMPFARLGDRLGNPLRLLMVHAHPDDETTTTGATAALYAAETIDVHLVTCTRGERGEILDPEVRRAVDAAADREQALGELRVRELAVAVEKLGIKGSRFLGGPGRWWDSGVAGADTNADPRSLVAGDRREQVDALAAVIREVRPQVLVTYDSRGGYGHPDHIRAHELSLAAVDRAAESDAESDAGFAAGAEADVEAIAELNADAGTESGAEAAPAWSVAKVYAAVVPFSVVRAVARRLGTGGGSPFAALAEALADGVPPDRIDIPYGVPDHLVTARIDARDWLDSKTAAMRAHRSQMPADGWFFKLAAIGDGGFGMEHFQLLRGTPGPVDDGFEADLFAGLRAVDDVDCEPDFGWPEYDQEPAAELP
ncbi:N-acetyl-1-D-myo-inositol-2-amino-2-deoxy-alpha-D-glucopyranoside deacetylase [Catenulispora sp. NF23]|uniref:1D-myo-inositol 2-acetamido-2-deoxy-alpha-D-glucopyranoside deacetylase n=1 Tax=Catenulispora pinistramenti TaxID=2705254 RepID=A0ABS5KXK1_9ACTN|nr:N-acetyl-1-D-myo-inositol-2-amino-2-deoxy-alpha-D-glucopyranoside deacetylase [Catenulispora pinistramenti]MBS2538868.1 N-acetyl-1-D-myo-inositol-2-amino-2-deoxy-alpha-D-glucopyranoside deacetylase [Catenulispora pinistramenti]MBS2550792.1 N-acetyl-1-D-myo-inositol-2-amino-2-deoxy-alpha-D-glucopyranoside deacetylase [Catenulispora pinistramenti]